MSEANPLPQALQDRILELGHITGRFVLRSGAVADSYYDKYRFMADPQTLGEICQAMAERLPDCDFVGGIEVGGIPLATGVSLASGKPLVIVRKAAKTYGTERLVEGADVTGKRVVLIEDVVTTGGQIVLSAAEIRKAGGTVVAALCVVDRNGTGRETLASHDIAYQPLMSVNP
jgi:orotate phosphoribosyltransferase